jgi:UDP-2-acetamido-3-amino-2,3-dideoxy-glucuronate N-acetyltransferase
MNNTAHLPSIHPNALIDPGAEIGKGTRVWAFAHVLKGAVIGENCNIGDFAFVESGAKLGNQVTVKNGVHVWDGVTAEDGVFLGPNCVFTNDRVPRSFIRRSREQYLVSTLLRQGCSIGANATIICGVTIGKYAFVAAGSVVSKDVPDYALVMGVPARFQRWICECGNKIEFQKQNGSCPSCTKRYQEIKPRQELKCIG